MTLPPHVLLFPFMSKGHMTPFLHLAHLLHHHHGATLTIVTTPANHSFISSSISQVRNNISIIILPFPQNIDGIPPGVESTDKLPSMSLFLPIAKATELMKPDFELLLNTLQNITFMVTDGFLSWTLDSAKKYRIPRLVSYGTGVYGVTMIRVVGQTSLLQLTESDSEEISFPDNHFPWIKLTRNDFEPKLSNPEPNSPYFQFALDMARATKNSYGLLFNSFYELESIFLEYWNKKCAPRAWSIGPLCLATHPSKSADQKPSWIDWLDKKLQQGNQVLYVSFGSQAEISKEQFEEIKVGLEKSGVNFLWVVRGNELKTSVGFENRVKDRGIVVKEWVDQRQILGHESVQGFLSHCGWNSVIESICAKVPILAWPMLAEQPLNAKMVVVEEIKIAIRVKTCDGTLEGLVKWKSLKMAVKELDGEIGKQVRKNVKEVGEKAFKAMEEGGSSRSSLSELINEVSNLQGKRINA